MHRLLVLFLSLLLLPSAANAQYAAAMQLGRVASIYVAPVFSFGDNDNQRCEPRSAELTTAAELMFRRSGISVTEQNYTIYDLLAERRPDPEFRALYERLPHLFTVALTGVYLSGRCAIAYNFRLQRTESIPASNTVTLGLVLSFNHAGVWTGPPSMATSVMKEQTEFAASYLANEILKTRQ